MGKTLDDKFSHTWDTMTHEGLLQFSEKFAELIVRECVQVCEPILDEPYENMTEFGKGLVEGQDVAIERIKEHFGVES
jgi:hypothetical protein